jgi:NDP-hexose-3-ketoreductase
MVDVLVIGVSSIVARRVLPALTALAAVKRIHLASRRELQPDLVPAAKRGRVFRGYQPALAGSDGGLAYISLPNSLHTQWARAALEAGFHVVIDKPATTALGDTLELLSLAQARGLCLAEATVWDRHPQIDAVAEMINASSASITRANTVFSFPPLASGNFRYDPTLGGGSLLDQGAYAASCGRAFFGEAPNEIIGRVHTRSASTGVDTSFSVLACYSGGRSLVGQFGFDTEYQNSVSLLGPGFQIEVDRVYTMPADLTNQIRCSRMNKTSLHTAPAGDSFALFLEAVLTAVANRSWTAFYRALEQDANFIHQLRRSAGAI